jgi:hypothetical protein
MKFFPNNFFSNNGLKAGIEICAGAIRSAVILKNEKGFLIRSLSNSPFSGDAIKPSFKTENILNPVLFEACLKKSYKENNPRKVGVSLPDTCIKVLIKEFKEIPKGDTHIHEMIVWNLSSSLNLAGEELRVSWKNMGQNEEEKQVFLIALGLDPVLAQYEAAFKTIGLAPLVLAPTGLNQFNFYSVLLPDQGCVAYLGLFDDFLNLFVFVEGIPIFHRMIKKGFLNQNNTSAIHDIDLLIQYFYAENPGLEIDSLNIASHIKSEAQIQYILQDLSYGEFTMMDERRLVNFEKRAALETQETSLPIYTGAFGAAMGI